MPPKLAMETKLRGTKLKICKCYYDNMRKEKPPPTFVEVAREVKLCNTSTVSQHLTDLVDKDIMYRFQAGRNYRNYHLTEHGVECVEAALNIKDIEPVPGIPVRGTTAAGEPYFIFGVPGDSIDMDRELGDDNIFTVRVRGDSMIGDHINDGDYVFVRQQSACVNGDIVVVSHIETSVEQGLAGYGYATLKRFFLEKDDDDIHLRSSNTDVDDIIVPKQKWSWSSDDKIEGKEWQIEGKVIAVFRRLHSS